MKESRRELNRKKVARRYEYYYVSYKKETKKKEPERIGKCRLCKKKYPLEDWQHSSLNWCPECRKTEEYLEYRGNQNHVYRLKTE